MKRWKGAWVARSLVPTTTFRFEGVLANGGAHYRRSLDVQWRPHTRYVPELAGIALDHGP
jgi:hypothetical protein